MASASNFLYEEQFQCSICLEVFTDPVSTTCGHNFCKNCILRHWKKSKMCPLCNTMFSKIPNLKINTGFRDVVESFKKSKGCDAADSLVKPGAVSCDVCTGTKLKALKSCLVCLSSYCKAHLEPHRRVSFLKRHKLMNPVENLEDRMCNKHYKLLELFCRSDQTCVCVMCIDHRHHDTVPLDEEYEKRKAQLGGKNAKVHEMIRERQEKIQELKLSVALSNKEIGKESIDCGLYLPALVASIQRNYMKLVEVINEKQKVAVRQADGFITELQQEITELRRTSTELEGLFSCEDHVHLIRKLSSLSSSQRTKDWSHTDVRTHLYIGMVRRSLAELEQALTEGMEDTINEVKWCNVNNNRKVTDKDHSERDKIMVNEEKDNMPESDALAKLQQQYAVDVTLDPDTAHQRLVLSGDLKRVHTVVCDMCPHDSPKRFDRYPCVLANEGFSSGMFYYEVEVGDKAGWDLGVVRESIDRKRDITPKPRSGFWVIRRNASTYKALNDPHVLLHLTNKPEKIGVFVDYEQGLVSFYNAEAASLIYSFKHCNFTERIFPLFSPRFVGKVSAPLIITSAKADWQRQLESFTWFGFCIVYGIVSLSKCFFNDPI